MYIEDLNTRYYVRRRLMVKAMGAVLAVITVAYTVYLFAELARSPFASGGSGPAALASLAGAWMCVGSSWLYLTSPLRVYRDRLEHMNLVIPVSRFKYIRRMDFIDETTFRVRPKSWRHTFLLPRYYHCDIGSPKCAAFEFLRREVERAAGRALTTEAGPSATRS